MAANGSAAPSDGDGWTDSQQLFFKQFSRNTKVMRELAVECADACPSACEPKQQLKWKDVTCAIYCEIQGNCGI